MYGGYFMNELKESRALSAFFLSTVEKKNQSEIAKILKVHRNTVSKDILQIRQQLQKEKEKITNIDIVYFYENELKKLLEKRESTKSHRYYLAYTKMIMELQEKIAEYLRLKEVLHIKHEHTGNVEVNITNIVKNVVAERTETIHTDNSPATRGLLLPGPEN